MAERAAEAERIRLEKAALFEKSTSKLLWSKVCLSYHVFAVRRGTKFVVTEDEGEDESTAVLGTAAVKVRFVSTDSLFRN